MVSQACRRPTTTTTTTRERSARCALCFYSILRTQEFCNSRLGRAGLDFYFFSPGGSISGPEDPGVFQNKENKENKVNKENKILSLRILKDSLRILRKSSVPEPPVSSQGVFGVFQNKENKENKENK